MHKTTFLLLMLGLLTTTRAYGIPRGKFHKRGYTEDLSSYRTKFTSLAPKADPKPIQQCRAKASTSIIPTHDITQRLQHLLADLKAYYAMVDSIQGYTIQVYAGGSRELAFKARNKLYTHWPTFKAKVHYKQPNFTVQIGRFLDRLEAYELYAAIKKMMPQAIIRPAYFPNEPGIFDNESLAQEEAAVAQTEQQEEKDEKDEEQTPSQEDNATNL